MNYATKQYFRFRKVQGAMIPIGWVCVAPSVRTLGFVFTALFVATATFPVSGHTNFFF